MTQHPHPAHGHGAGQGLAHFLLVRFIAAMLLGLLGAAVTWPLQEVWPLRSVAERGVDAVVGEAARRPQDHFRPDARRLVVVALDTQHPMRPQRLALAELLNHLRNAGPAVIALVIAPDLEVAPDFDSEQGTAELRAALDTQGRPPIFLGVARPPSPEAGGDRLGQIVPHVRLGVVHDAPHLTLVSMLLLAHKRDATVRYVEDSQCWPFPPDGERRSVPALSVAAATLAREPEARASLNTPCRTHHGRAERVLFLTRAPQRNESWVDRGVAQHPPPVTRLFASEVRGLLAENDFRDLLRGAVVLVGAVGSPDNGDLHHTPIGLMPGLYVHANALLTQLHVRGEHSVSVPQKALFKLALITLVATTLTFLFWLPVHRIERSLAARREARTLTFAALLLRRLVIVLLYVFAVAVALAGVIFMALSAGLRFWVMGGAAFASFAPALMVLLEALAEAGRPVLNALHRVAERMAGVLLGTGRRQVRALLVPTLLVPLLAPAAFAQPSRPIILVQLVDVEDRTHLRLQAGERSTVPTVTFQVRPGDRLANGTHGRDVQFEIHLAGRVERRTLPSGSSYEFREPPAEPKPHRLWQIVTELIERFLRRSEPHRLQGGSRVDAPALDSRAIFGIVGRAGIADLSFVGAATSLSMRDPRTRATHSDAPCDDHRASVGLNLFGAPPDVLPQVLVTGQASRLAFAWCPSGLPGPTTLQGEVLGARGRSLAVATSTTGVLEFSLSAAQAAAAHRLHLTLRDGAGEARVRAFVPLAWIPASDRPAPPADFAAALAALEVAPADLQPLALGAILALEAAGDRDAILFRAMLERPAPEPPRRR
jgi:CHASE2 domain-containing sensor protein